MKRVALVLVAFACIVSVAAAVEVTSENMVGVKKMGLATNYNFLAYNWVDIGGVKQIDVQEVGQAHHVGHDVGEFLLDVVEPWLVVDE